MIPFPYNYLTAVLVVGASLGGAFLYGQHTATVSAERDTLERDVAMYHSVDVLARKLRDADEALLVEQQRVVKVQRVEVIKYVDKYRTVVREAPSVVKCIDNSGLLDLLNATTPTVAGVKPAK